MHGDSFVMTDVLLPRTQTTLGMDPTYFSFRWITLMLSQEFFLPGRCGFVLPIAPPPPPSFCYTCMDTHSLTHSLTITEVIRIWDSLFADEKRFTFLLYVCGAMILWASQNTHCLAVLVCVLIPHYHCVCPDSILSLCVSWFHTITVCVLIPYYRCVCLDSIIIGSSEQTFWRETSVHVWSYYRSVWIRR